MSSGDTNFVYKWIFKFCENSSSSKYREEKAIKRGILTLLQRIFYENPVYTKVASVELPTKVSSSTFSNNYNVHLKRENVEKIANDHHGDHRSVLKHQTNTSAECTLDAGILDENPVAGILDENPVAGEIVKKPKSELTEFGKLPSSEFTSYA
ncbi:hypothetical protein OROMI_032887 [Orobanche minor]